MPLKDSLAALIVIVAWGVNFVVIKVGLQEIPPFLLGFLRFALVALAAFFVPRPAVSWRLLILFGMTLSYGQFAFLFTAMTTGISAGLASLVLQSQAFFTVLIAAILLGERVRAHHIAGMTVAAIGLGLIEHGAHGGNITALGFILTLAAAFCWACGNIVVKYTNKADVLGLVVWGAVVPPIPFLLTSLALEGKEAIYHSLANLSLLGFGALIYLALIATTLGYVLWAKLLNRHPVSKIAPLSLLIPVVGLISADLLMDESLSPAQWLGAGVVVVGLAINMLGSRFARWRTALR